MAILKTIEGKYQCFNNWDYRGLTEKEEFQTPELFIYDPIYKAHYAIYHYCLYDENQKVVYKLDYLFDRKNKKPLSHLNFKNIFRLPSRSTCRYEDNLKKIKGKAYFEKTGSRSYQINDINVTSCNLYLPLKWFKVKKVSRELVEENEKTQIYNKTWFYYKEYKFEYMVFDKEIKHKKNEEFIDEFRKLGFKIKSPCSIWGEEFTQNNIDLLLYNLKNFVKEYKNPKVEK